MPPAGSGDVVVTTMKLFHLSIDEGGGYNLPPHSFAMADFRQLRGIRLEELVFSFATKRVEREQARNEYEC